MKTKITTILFTAVFFFIPFTSQAEDNVVHAPIEGLIESQTCGSKGCHTRINREWASTMHASSTPEKDPLVKAFYDYLEKQDFDTKMCNNCHVPVKAAYGNKGDSPVFGEGVTCSFCHSIYGLSGIPGGHGYEYYKLNFNKASASPYRPDGESAHDTNFITMFRTVDMCGGCHQEGETDFIVENNRKMICQTCHMPSKQQKSSADHTNKKDKVFRHLFEGGHSKDLLSLAITVHDGEISTTDKSTTFKFNIESGAYHEIPIGFPFRSIYIQVLAKDDHDNVIWQNYKEHPYDEDPTSYFGRIFKKEDDIYAHHARDAEPVWKQLIPPKTAVPLSYTVKSTKVAYFEVRGYYRLLTDRVIEKLNLPEDTAPETLILNEVFYVD